MQHHCCQSNEVTVTVTAQKKQMPWKNAEGKQNNDNSIKQLKRSRKAKTLMG